MAVDYLRQDGTRLTGTLARGPDHARLTTVVRFGTLRTHLVRHSPKDVEDAAHRPNRHGRPLLPHDVEALQRLRGAIQREFKGNRKKNLYKFATYLRRRALAGKPYSLPPIALWTPDEVVCDLLDLRDGLSGLRPLADNDYGVLGLAVVYIDPTAQVIAIDGETQMAALFEVRNQLSAEQDQMGLKALDGLALDVQFHFHAGTEWAHHAFNVRNREGVKQTGLSLAAAQSDPHLWVLQSLIDANPHLKPFTDVKARQASPAKPLTGSALLLFIQCLHVGTVGAQKNKTPKDIDGQDLEQLREQALDWFEALAQVLGDRLHSPDSICPAGQILGALGTLGHDVLRQADPTRRRRRDAVLARLQHIDWSKGPHWLDIAGKRAANGALSVGGGATVYLARTYAAIAGDDTGSARQIEQAVMA